MGLLVVGRLVKNPCVVNKEKIIGLTVVGRSSSYYYWYFFSLLTS